MLWMETNGCPIVGFISLHNAGVSKPTAQGVNNDEYKTPFITSSLTSLVPTAPPGLLAMSVHIVNEEPVQVIPGSALLLKARVEHGPLEDITMVTWEREPETGVSPRRVTLATCPGRRAECPGSRSNVLVRVEQQDTSLQINGYSAEDSGVYTVTTTGPRGASVSAQCIVRTYGTVIEHLFISQAR